jgi:hypothetical protein
MAFAWRLALLLGISSLSLGCQPKQEVSAEPGAKKSKKEGAKADKKHEVKADEHARWRSSTSTATPSRRA